MIHWNVFRSLAAAALLCLSLPSAQAQSVVAGEISVELAATPGSSYLGVDVSQLAASLCMAPPTIRDPRLVVANDGGNTGRAFGLDVMGATELAGGTTIVADILPASLHLVSPAPLATSCGYWNYQVSLDTGRLPNLSTLTLVRTHPSDPGGAFSGLVTFPATLELTLEGGGPTRLFFYTLSFNLAGTWGLAPLGGKGISPPSAAASNLVLFAHKSGPAWVKNAQLAGQESLEDPSLGQFTLQATDAEISWLNLRQPLR